MISNLWNNFGLLQKRLTMIAATLTALGVIGGTAWAAAEVVVTDTELDAEIAAITQKIDDYADEQLSKDEQEAIRDYRWRLEDIEYRLLDQNLPDVQEAYLKQSKAKILRRIACIQAAQVHCD